MTAVQGIRDRMMRILMVAQFYPPVIGGEERMVEALSVGLARRGHSVAVATLAIDGRPPEEERDGVRIHMLPSTMRRLPFAFQDPGRPQAMPAPDPATVVALRRVLRRERPDVVHAHNWLVHSFLPLKARSGARLVMSLHDFSFVCATKRWMYEGSPCSGPGPRKCIDCSSAHYGAIKGIPVALALAGMHSFVASAVDLFTPVSQAVADGSGLADEGLRYEVVPNFLPDAFPSAGPSDLEVRGLPSDGFLLFVGDCTYDKGADLLLDAYALLRDPPPLVLIGRPLSARLSSPPPGVVLLGPRPHPEVLAAWGRCSIAIVPSVLQDAFPVSALEAQALGRPIIAAAHGGLVEVVRHEETGLLVPPGNSQALAQAIDRLLDDEALRTRLGAAGRQRARLFTASAVLPRVESAYGRALGAE